MTPNDVISSLTSANVPMTRQTLLRYEWQGLIPKPGRGCFGRSQGRWTEYPAGTVKQAYAAAAMLHGRYGMHSLFNTNLSPYQVANIRNAVLFGCNMFDDPLSYGMETIYKKLLGAIEE